VPWAAVLALPGLMITAVFILGVLQTVFSGPLNERWKGFRGFECDGAGDSGAGVGIDAGGGGISGFIGAVVQPDGGGIGDWRWTVSMTRKSSMVPERDVPFVANFIAHFIERPLSKSSAGLHYIHTKRGKGEARWHPIIELNRNYCAVRLRITPQANQCLQLGHQSSKVAIKVATKFAIKCAMKIPGREMMMAWRGGDHVGREETGC
jgi:hypothetical protein